MDSRWNEGNYRISVSSGVTSHSRRTQCGGESVSCGLQAVVFVPLGLRIIMPYIPVRFHHSRRRVRNDRVRTALLSGSLPEPHEKRVVVPHSRWSDAGTGECRHRIPASGDRFTDVSTVPSLAAGRPPLRRYPVAIGDHDDRGPRIDRRVDRVRKQHDKNAARRRRFHH